MKNLASPRRTGPSAPRRARGTIRVAAAVAAAAGLMLAGVPAASAHVSVTPDGTEAGSYSLLTFSVPHGCEGSPTTKIRINLPKQITEVTPTVNPNWTIETLEQKLDKPRELPSGTTITKKMGAVVYTAKTPLPDHRRDTFVLSLKLPADAAGETLRFPTVQTCEEGSTTWDDVPKSGQSHEDLAAPVPSITVTAADAGTGHDPTAAGSAAESGSDPASDSSSTGASATTVPGYVGLGAGILGLIVAVIALVRTRRPRS